MAEIDIAITRQFSVSADFDTVWALLVDTQATVEHYPSLEKLVDLGDHSWRWELQPTGVKNISYQLIYSVRYGFDRDTGVISWTPLKAEGDNGHIRGQFDITTVDDKTSVTLTTDGSLDIPIPRLLAIAAKPLVEREFNQQIEKFVGNLESALNAG